MRRVRGFSVFISSTSGRWALPNLPSFVCEFVIQLGSNYVGIAYFYAKLARVFLVACCDCVASNPLYKT